MGWSHIKHGVECSFLMLLFLFDPDAVLYWGWKHVDTSTYHMAVLAAYCVVCHCDLRHVSLNHKMALCGIQNETSQNTKNLR